MFVVYYIGGNSAVALKKFEEEWEALEFLDNQIQEDIAEIMENEDVSASEAYDMVSQYYSIRREDDD